MDEANPTGIRLSQQQLDESRRDSYWEHSVRYALQYYLAGRFAMMIPEMPVSANLFHHAVELMLKACLARTDTWGRVRTYQRRFNHDLTRLWAAFRERYSADTFDAHEPVIRALHAFEDIRYPDKLLETGAVIQIGFAEVARQAAGAAPKGVPRFELALAEIERLFNALLDASGCNPDLIADRIEETQLRFDTYTAIAPPIALRSAPT